MNVDDEVKKQLDAVVGERYEPPRKPREMLLKWLAAAVLGVAMALLVMFVLHKHLTDAQTAAAPAKPVPVQIVPAR